MLTVEVTLVVARYRTLLVSRESGEIASGLFLKEVSRKSIAGLELQRARDPEQEKSCGQRAVLALLSIEDQSALIEMGPDHVP